jgi:hypothetical protein
MWTIAPSSSRVSTVTPENSISGLVRATHSLYGSARQFLLLQELFDPTGEKEKEPRTQMNRSSQPSSVDWLSRTCFAQQWFQP